MSRRSLGLSVGAMLIACTFVVEAQEFAAASIKVMQAAGKKPGAVAIGSIEGAVAEPPQGGRVRAQATARTLIRYAYGQASSNGVLVRPLEAARVIGGPGWIDDTMFAIEARMDDPSSGPAARMQMMLQLLEDRFHLRVRRESRESAVYNLMLARADRRFGPDLHELTANCVPVTQNGRETPCAMRNGLGTLTGHGVAMSAFATYLSPLAGRIVVDKTALTGRYDLSLTFAPPSAQGTTPETSPGDGPSLFAALPEQLGLRLEAARSAIDVIVVERIDRPSED